MSEEKDELLLLLRYMEKMMRVNPEGLIKSPEYKEKVNRFNSLSSIAPTLGFTEREQKEAKTLWESLKSLTEKYNKKLASEAALSPQELFLKTLREINEKWSEVSRQERRALIEKASRLQLQRNVIDNMTPDERDEYHHLMGTIRNSATIEEIPLEELEEEARRRSGL